jgi:hypothetical protein
MTPHTLHRITQEVRHLRALLTVEETWAQAQPKTVTRDETFRRVTFWRYILRLTELVVGEYDQWRNDADAHDQRRRFWRSVVTVAEHQLAIQQSGHLGTSASSRPRRADAVCRQTPLSQGV